MFIRAKCVLGIRDKNGTGPIYPGVIAEVDDAAGNRMIKQGAAEEVHRCAARSAGKAAPDAGTGENPSNDGNAQNGPSDGLHEVIDLEAMTYTELKAMAQEMGINTGKLKSKAQMIEAITQAMPGLPADDELPELTPQDVIDE